MKTTAIQAGWFDDSQNKELPATLTPRPAIEIRRGDLLITCAGPRSRCGVPALVRETRPRLMMSGKMYRFRTSDRLDPEFLEKWLLSPEAQKRIDSMKTGISDSGLNLTHGRFLQLPVPVPSRSEQRRIVEVLEDHLSHLESGSGALQSSARRIEGMRLAKTHQLMQGSTRRLGDLKRSADYGTSVKCSYEGQGIAVLRIPNIKEGSIDRSDVKFAIDSMADLSGFMVDEGDVLIVRTNGSRSLIGRSAVVGESSDAAFASYLIRYKVDRDVVLPEWLHLSLESPRVREEIERLAASSAGQHNLSLGKLDSLELPIPDLSEQRTALLAFREFDAETRRLKRALASVKAHSEALRRAVLAAAFEGKLTGRHTDTEVIEEMAHVQP